jgi:hypothetical protein
LKAVAAQVAAKRFTGFTRRPSSLQVFFGSNLGLLVSKGGHLGLPFLSRNCPLPLARRTGDQVCFLDQNILETSKAPGHVTWMANDRIVFFNNNPVTAILGCHSNPTLGTLPTLVANAGIAVFVLLGC